ncbi:hypothetical protein Vretimale_5755 [Volvox reticuliferus]|uniref:THIF-type NAD/FAD binding fold domain-containing protein n=1 Tax=Volvox reticuliferus TaxID=1737510 RepID=A0A8J4LLE7_9CHLO|nr:hypothetical protein Vretifemale_5858 [Volvox reticuliferus]GIM00862.1 hypothetical protein Vretimale_5755 [Volvox reticuliferus]
MHLGWRPCLIFRCKGAAKCTATLPAVALRPVHTVAWLCPTQIRRTSSTHSGLCFSNSDTCKVALVPIRAVSGAKAAVELESVTTVLEQGQSASPLSNGGHTNHTGIARKGASTHTPHMALHGPSDSSPDISEQAHRLESGAPESTGAAAVASSVRVEAETGVRRAAGAAGAAEPEYQPAVNDSDAAEAPEWLQRTTLLLGHGGVAALRDTRVVLVGLGGVGSYVAEFLVRAGVGSLAIVDGDVVDVTNKNRQLPALDSTIGLPKAHVMSRRLLDINPDLHLVARQEFLSPDTAGEQLLDDVVAELDRGARAKGGAAAGVVSGATCVCVSRGDGSRTSASGDGEADGAYCSVRDLGGSTSTSTSTSTSGGSGEAGDHGGSTDALKVDPLLWVVDCIDSVAPKLALVAAATRRGARVISSMGAGAVQRHGPHPPFRFLTVLKLCTYVDANADMRSAGLGLGSQDLRILVVAKWGWPQRVSVCGRALSRGCSFKSARHVHEEANAVKVSVPFKGA